MRPVSLGLVPAFACLNRAYAGRLAELEKRMERIYQRAAHI